MDATRVLALAVLVCLWCGSWALTCGPDGPPQVNTKQGLIHGYCTNPPGVEGRVVSFLGVPYALPPTGTRRFQNPKMATTRTGVLNATDYKPSCLRFPTDLFEPKTGLDAPIDHSGGAHSGAHGGSHGGAHVTTHNTAASTHTDHSMPMNFEDEDCLYLNIFVPDNQTDPLPVLIWFPGHDRQFDGSRLAARGNIILITVSFRTGILGFLSVDKETVTGNYGLFDQRLSMTWVKENIASFGGDSSKVTIAGHGISGAMVGLHLLHDPKQTPFNRAISMSGYTVDPYFVRNIAPMQEIVHNHLKCTGEKMLQCLQSKTVSELTTHQGHIRSMFPYSVIYGPTVDENFLKKDPLALLEEGHFSKVDYLLGGNKDDGTIVFNLVSPETIANFTDKDFFNTVKKISSQVFRSTDSVPAAIQGRYYPASGQTYRYSLVRILSDYLQANALISARYHAKYANVYYFLLAEASDEDKMVPYDSLLPLVLGVSQDSEHKNHSMDGEHTGHTTGMPSGHAGHPTTMAGGHAGHTTGMPGSHAGHATTMAGGHAGHSGHSNTESFSHTVMSAWAKFVETGIPTMNNGIDWLPFNSSSPTYLELMVNMTPESANKAPDAESYRFWTVALPVLASVGDVSLTTSSPGHGHGDHTTAGHDHASHEEPMFGLDLQTASEAILALTIVVCFLFVVVVVLLFVNFVYAPRKLSVKSAREYEVQDNGAFAVEEPATKM